MFLNCKPINPEGLTRFRGWSGDTHLEMFARTDHPRFGWSRRWMRRWGQASNAIVGAVLEGCSSVWPRRSWPKRISGWFGPPAGGAGNRAGAGIVFDDCRRCGAADCRYTVEGRGTGVARVTERMLARLPKAFGSLLERAFCNWKAVGFRDPRLPQCNVDDLQRFRAAYLSLRVHERCPTGRRWTIDCGNFQDRTEDQVER